MSHADYVSSAGLAKLADLPDMRPHHFWLYMGHEDVKNIVGKYKRGEISAALAHLNIRRAVRNTTHRVQSPLPPSPEVGCPRQNRGTCPLSSEDVRQLTGDITAAGWTTGAVDCTTCFQVPQGDALTIDREDPCRRLAMSSVDDPPGAAPESEITGMHKLFQKWSKDERKMSSGDDTPAVAPGSTTYASLSCGHTIAVLRAMRSSNGWGNSALGNAVADPRFNGAAQRGLDWHVIQADVRPANPEGHRRINGHGRF